MLENSIYSILSPEGFASILWKDPSKVKEACDVMKITSKDLLEFNIIDGIIKEVDGGAQNNKEQVAFNIKNTIINKLNSLEKISKEEILNQRYEKFRNIGKFY